MHADVHHGYKIIVDITQYPRTSRGTRRSLLKTILTKNANGYLKSIYDCVRLTTFNNLLFYC